MKQFAVYHLEKGSVSSGGIGNHIDRKIGAEHSYKHADPTLKNLNIHLDLNKYTSLPLDEAIKERLKDGYKSLKTIRKDAVKYTTHILTGSHDRMKEIEKNPEELNKWIEENKYFIEQEYGAENIVRFVVHRDEKTPHIHAITVNLTRDGRLSGKEIIGNKKKMQNRQDKYAKFMKPFKLERGIKNTKIKHEDATKYYSRMKESLAASESIEDLKVNKIVLGVKIGLDIESTINNYENALKREKTINFGVLEKLSTQENRLENIYNQNLELEKEKENFKKFFQSIFEEEGYFENSNEIYFKNQRDD